MARASRAAWSFVTIGIAAGLVCSLLPRLWQSLSAPPAAYDSGPSLGLEASSAPSGCEPPASAASRLLRAPSDDPARLTCEQAHRIVLLAREHLAQPAPSVDAASFATGLSDWLDPHGLWSAAPDSPLGAALRDQAPALLEVLEKDTPPNCSAAVRLGTQLAQWVDGLRVSYDKARTQSEAAPVVVGAVAWKTASESVFENGPVTRPGHELAAELGRRIGLVGKRLGSGFDEVQASARRRLFPPLSAEQWAEVVLAAAVRSYILQIDPHGAWAPLDEETSLYEVELEASGRMRLWSRMSRTAVGLRIEQDPVPPLENGDVLLEIGGIPTAGLSVEQAEQLGVLDPGDPQPDRDVMLWRQGKTLPMTLRVSPEMPLPPDEELSSIAVERVPYRDSEAVVLAVPDVPDNLGEELASVLAEERQKQTVQGVLLDLRGNGGGSIDGAKAAIALFLPGAPLFPMRKHDGSVEVEAAPYPPMTDQWHGPVAVLVDGNTASAAEMISGALLSYHRAVVLGSRTFGKGCAQEYLEDDVGVGILRLTTLIYALPDGSPVQQVGLQPELLLGVEPGSEREEMLPHTFKPWRGPDVRRATQVMQVPWPAFGGRLGPCKDPIVCKALRLVGAPRPATARSPQSP